MRLEKLILETKESFHVPGISVSVMKDNEKMHYGFGFADCEENTEAASDTVYCIGSSTKAFIATALCILAEEGRIDIDMPVKTYLTEFQMYDGYSTEHLTVRDALSHRSGLPRHDTSWLNTPARTTAEQVAALAYMEPAWPLRYRFHYQNHMFMVATLIVEKVSGMHWGDFVRERILNPLQMNSTYIYGDEIEDGDVRKARPYMLSGEKPLRMPYNYMKSAGGAGTIYSTTEDMLKWLAFRLNGNDQVLSKEWLEEMHEPQTIIRPAEIPEIQFTSYGLGWFIESYKGYKIVHHGGTVEGFKSEQIFVQGKNIAVSMLCNLNQTKAMAALGYKLLDELLGAGRSDWDRKYLDACMEAEKKNSEAMKSAIESAKKLVKECGDIEQYKGTYEHKAYGEAAVSSDGKNVLLSMIGLTLPILQTGEDRFHLMVESYELFFPVEFIRNDKGRVCALEIPLEEKLRHKPIRFERKEQRQS